jgi:hypothetical protein
LLQYFFAQYFHSNVDDEDTLNSIFTIIIITIYSNHCKKQQQQTVLSISMSHILTKGTIDQYPARDP